MSCGHVYTRMYIYMDGYHRIYYDGVSRMKIYYKYYIWYLYYNIRPKIVRW